MNPYRSSVVDEPVVAVPCESDPDRWFVEPTTPAKRELVDFAIFECLSCPLLAECGELAAKLRPAYGVWAGKDWTAGASKQPRGDRITRKQLGGTRSKMGA